MNIWWEVDGVLVVDDLTVHILKFWMESVGSTGGSEWTEVKQWNENTTHVLQVTNIRKTKPNKNSMRATGNDLSAPAEQLEEKMDVVAALSSC